jgi:hypothetical protein
MEGDLNEPAVGGTVAGLTLPADVLPEPWTRTGTVVGEATEARKEDGRVYLVVQVPGDGPQGEGMEYVGSVSEERLARLPGPAQREALLDAVREERDRRRALDAVRVEGLVGPVLL